VKNLEEMDKFLDVYDLPKLDHVDISHLHRSIICNEIEVVIVSQKRKAQELMDSLLNSARPFKKR
jgi:hypothetical protein